jgi:hypothetical protein
MANLARFDHLVGHPPLGIRHRLNTYRHHAVVLLHHIDNSVRLVDGLGHWFFAIDILARLRGIDRNLGMPVIGRGDANDIHFLEVKNAAIVLGDMGFVVGIKAHGFGRRVKPLGIKLFFGLSVGDPGELGFVAVPNIANGDSRDILLVFCALVDDLEVGLAATSHTNKSDSHTVVGAYCACIGRRAEVKGACASRRRADETPAIEGGLFLAHAESLQKNQLKGDNYQFGLLMAYPLGSRRKTLFG